MSVDLVARLTEAATAAIANERPSLEHRPETIRGLTVEVTLGKAGGLSDVIVYIERRTASGALLDHHTVRAG
jgi:hypothetical protein